MMDEATLLADAQDRLDKIERDLENKDIGEEERKSLRRLQETWTNQIDKLTTALLAARPGAPSTSGAGGSGPPPSVDDSVKIVEDWLVGIPDKLPPVPSLHSFLATKPANVKLPLGLDVQQQLRNGMRKWEPLCQHVQDTASAQALFTSFRFAALYKYTGGTEMMTAILTQNVLIEPLKAIDASAPGELRLDLDVERNAGDRSGITSKSSKSKLQRPDGQLKVLRRAAPALLIEEKARSLSAARQDLLDKHDVSCPIFSGCLPYHLCLAAAGSLVQLFALPKKGQLVAITKEFDLTSLGDRVDLLLTAVQLYKLLVCVSKALPQGILPSAFTDTSGWTRNVDFTERITVKKTIGKWSLYTKDFPGVSEGHLRKLYKAVKDAPGVVHAVKGPTVTNDQFEVTLAPVGLLDVDAYPREESHLRRAALGIATGLSAIHKAGFNHRDLRWPNVSCDPDRNYFLIDLEAAAREGSSGQAWLAEWGTHTLTAVGKAKLYTKESDMYQFGRMLNASRKDCGLPKGWAGAPLVKKLLSADPNKRPSASAVLNDPWLIQPTPSSPGSEDDGAGATTAVDAVPGASPPLGAQKAAKGGVRKKKAREGGKAPASPAKKRRRH